MMSARSSFVEPAESVADTSWLTKHDDL